jgi:DNA invertase Pin-like site-specific DNA recombinase
VTALHLALYLRVSTLGQVDGESLPEQERNGRAWAEANGHRVAAVYTDPGLSGKLPASERPGLEAALDALAVGAVDGLLMRDLDRLAREVTVQEAVLAQIWMSPDTHVFTFQGEVLRDDPDDPMRTAMRQMAGVFAGLERRVIVKRLRDGRRTKARNGGHAVGPAPYGWVSRKGELIPVPDEQRALTLMRDLAAAGARHVDIAEALRVAGHPTKRGGGWSQPVVSRILARDAARSREQRHYQAAQLKKHAAEPQPV